MPLIGLIGVSKAGKTTGAEYLVRKHGFIENSFASPLKKACQELFLLTDEQLYGPQDLREKPDPRWFNCSPRTMLQFIGTDLLRNQLDTIMPGLDQAIFIHHFRIWYEELMQRDPTANVVISDLRFPNEVDFIQSLGGYLIKIERSSIQNNTCTHITEAGVKDLDNYHALIHNNGSVEELYSKLDACVTASRSRTD